MQDGGEDIRLTMSISADARTRPVCPLGIESRQLFKDLRRNNRIGRPSPRLSPCLSCLSAKGTKGRRFGETPKAGGAREIGRRNPRLRKTGERVPNEARRVRGWLGYSASLYSIGSGANVNPAISMSISMPSRDSGRTSDS
jgi:hypothetical protein